MYKLRTRLLERRDSVKCKFVIGIYSHSGTGHDHGAESFVCFEEVFRDGVGDGDEVRFQVFGVLDYEGGVDDCGEGFVGEVAAAGG